MAFVCTIDGKWGEFSGFDWGDESTLVASVGHDDELPVSYSAVVGLSPAAGELEFVFYLVEDNPITSEVRQHWAGREVGKFIPKDARERILRAFLFAARVLVDHVRPASFFMITFEADLPPKALIKAELMCEVFRQIGYSVTEREPQHGKQWWKMELISDDGHS